MTPAAETWVYDPQQGIYYQASTSTYALPNASGEWTYLPTSEFHAAESSAMAQGVSTAHEEGEIEDDVGWGGLMEPEQLAAVVSSAADTAVRRRLDRHPAYGGYDDPDPVVAPDPPPTPAHLLRLVVTRSQVLATGHIAVLDAREGGIQIGRDRCERGAQARIRVKEMEASKTHAVVYWGRAGTEDDRNSNSDEADGWWAVDLGNLTPRCLG